MPKDMSLAVTKHRSLIKNDSGEREIASVDSDSAVEQELRLRVELFQSSARQERRTQQDV